MARVNDSFLKLKDSYLFVEIARRVRQYKAANPEKEVISLGIGDVTLPLAPAVTAAMKKAVEEQSAAASFRGYGPDRGYDFLINAIVENDYKARGIDIDNEEIIISDGAKSDCGNICDIFAQNSRVLVSEPAYPVYVDSSIMAGRRVSFVKCGPEDGFVPAPPKEEADIVFLCSPNNPTGSVMTKEQLFAWVKYAREKDAVIIFDSAYEAYIKDPSLPRSIYEIEGARECAIEIRSFSKTAGFTGVRCGYTVVPKALLGTDENGNKISLNKLWVRRQGTKFNGASYISQKGAQAIYSKEGRAQCGELIGYYMQNAAIIKKAVDELGLQSTGGINSPYVWLRCPNGMTSWEFFDFLLNGQSVVGTPGSGFGSSGEGWFRLTAFGSRENTIKAADRLKKLLK